jgi:small multidrug resistance pump
MGPKLLCYIYLLLAIISETIATVSLIYTKEFTRFWPSVGVLLLYVIGLFFLTLSLRIIPLGIAYAIWAGLGIVLVAILGYVLHGQKLDTFAVLGIFLILVGIVIINLLSKSVHQCV